MNSKKRTLTGANLYSTDSEPPKKRQRFTETCHERSAAPQPPVDLKKADETTLDLAVNGFFHSTIQVPTDIKKLIVKFLFFPHPSNHNECNNVNERNHINEPPTNFLL